jgi:hypothetical protein
MNSNEQKVADAYKQARWAVLRNGWPDFLMYRRTANGKVEIRAVEVKSKTDKLSTAQKAMHRVLSRFGVRIDVVYTSKDNPFVMQPIKPTGRTPRADSGFT